MTLFIYSFLGTVLPALKDLLKAKIPVVGGFQQAGDLVIIPSTTIHFGYTQVP
jgi:hypothetical protein